MTGTVSAPISPTALAAAGRPVRFRNTQAIPKKTIGTATEEWRPEVGVAYDVTEVAERKEDEDHDDGEQYAQIGERVRRKIGCRSFPRLAQLLAECGRERARWSRRRCGLRHRFRRRLLRVWLRTL